MTNSSVQSEDDLSLLGVAGWFLFLWAVSHVCPSTWRAHWRFDGWVSPVISAASCGVGGLATIAIAMMFVNQERRPLFKMPLELLGVMAGWGLVFLALVALLHLVSAQGIGVPASAVVDDPLTSQIEQLRERQGKVGTLIGELEGQRSTIIGRLRQTKSDTDLHVLGHELLEIDRTLKQLKREAEKATLTVAKGESLLRKNDRQKRLSDAGIDSNELATLRVRIEDSLRSDSAPQSAGEAIQIDKVVGAARRSGSD